MRMMEAMIACNWGGPIEVGPWPDRRGWSDGYALTFGACYMERHELTAAMQVALMFIDFQQVVADYEVPVADAHREFQKIEEYRWHIAPDSRGAEEMPDEWARMVRGGLAASAKASTRDIFSTE